MEVKKDSRTLVEKDIEWLKEIRNSISEGVACTYDKEKCLDHLESIISPKCAICRKSLDEEILVVGGHKMHKNCRKQYHG